ncbi:hypothetical protein EYR36_001883 [Pleurotus pulmonarius]|nr:hypothetical protein EYR36_001883 [Pleurotus pulmonarius]
MHSLTQISGDYLSADDIAAHRGIPLSQFLDEYPHPDTQLIRCQASNRGDDRRCFVTVQLSTLDFYDITGVDWSATNIPPTFPSSSGAFQSLNNLHLKFPSHASQDRNSSHQDGLTITISAREISFSTGTDSVSLGNGFTVSISMQTDQAASIWKAVPSEPAPGRKGISTLVHRFARLIRFGPPRAADNKLHRSR